MDEELKKNVEVLKETKEGEQPGREESSKVESNLEGPFISKSGKHYGFRKGVVTNPNGRRKGSKNRFSIAELAQAIKKVEKEKQKSFMKAWIEAAWGDADKMSSIANYMLPKLKSIEGILATFESSMSDELAQAIQDKLKERYCK